MSFLDALVGIFGFALIVGSLFYTYERSALIFSRKYSAYPKDLLSNQYMADILLLCKYFLFLLYGAGIICLIVSPSLGIDMAIVVNTACVLYYAANSICYYRYGLKKTFYDLREKWEKGVLYKEYIDEVNVYRAIRDSQNFVFLCVVCLIHFIVFICALI